MNTEALQQQISFKMQDTEVQRTFCPGCSEVQVRRTLFDLVLRSAQFCCSFLVYTSACACVRQAVKPSNKDQGPVVKDHVLILGMNLKGVTFQKKAQGV